MDGIKQKIKLVGGICTAWSR